MKCTTTNMECYEIQPLIMSDIKLEALDSIDDHRLSLTMADKKAEVFACTWETTSPSSSLVTEDIKQEPLADDYNEHLSPNRSDPNVVHSTDHKTSLSTLFRTTNVKCEPLEINFNQQLPSHSINLQEDNFKNENEHMSFVFPMTENQPLNINDYTKEYDKGSFSDGQLYLTENEDLGIKEIIVANDELPFEIQLLQNTNITLNEKNRFENTENKMGDIDHLPNLSTVQNEIEVENIDQTSDILHEQKQNQIETNDINQKGSNNKIENIHQTSDLLQGQKQPKIRIITNRNFTYCNRIENQPHVIRIKKGKVQDETPTLNQYQETIGEYELTTSMHNEIEVENIERTSDILHEQKQKQIETNDINQTGSNNKIENIHQTSDLLQGQKRPKIRIITNRNFTYCNHIENQPHVIRIKKGEVQDETPTLNQYQETIGEYELATSMDNEIEVENIERTSDILHEQKQKQIETNDIDQTGSNKKIENIHVQQTLDLLPGQKQPKIGIIANRNFTYCNHVENQPRVIMIKKVDVQDESPKLNLFQETIGEYEQTTCMHHFLPSNSYLEHDHNYYNMPKEERKTDNPRKEKQISSVHNFLTYLEHDHNYYNMPKEERKAENERKEKQANILRAQTEEKSILKKQRNEEKLKAIEEKRKISLQPVPCPICGKMIRPRHMSRHKSTQHSGESFLCKFCGMLFQSRKEVTHHEILNHDVGPIQSKQCDICHKTFKSRRVMREHRTRIHIKKRKHNFLCSVCGKKFPALYDLNRHTSTHFDEKPFKCHHCDAEFKLRSYLQKHIGFCHVPRKILSCTESGCERKYIRKDSLWRHVKWHRTCKTDEKPFKCHHCDAEFRLRRYLQKHIGCCHVPRKILSCTESGCERKYISKDSLRRHVKWHGTCKADTSQIHTT